MCQLRKRPDTTHDIHLLVKSVLDNGPVTVKKISHEKINTESIHDVVKKYFIRRHPKYDEY